MSTQSNDSELASRRDVLRVSGATAAAIVSGMALPVGRAYAADTKKKIRLAVVGGGFGASFYWHEHPNWVVTGVTDLLPDRREKLKKVYKCDTAYDSEKKRHGRRKGTRTQISIRVLDPFAFSLDPFAFSSLRGW